MSAIDVKAVLQADVLRYQAMLRSDTAALDRLLTDDMTYVHTKGHVDTKQEFLLALSSGRRKYISLQVESRHAKLFGSIAVLTGVASAHGQTDGKEGRPHLQYTAVYVKQGEQWRMTAWQATRIVEG